MIISRRVDAHQADWDDASRAVITDKWRPVALIDDRIDRRGYTLCVLDRLRSALRRREVFVPAADRWGDPRRLLLDDHAWKRHQAPVFATLGLDMGPRSYLDQLGVELDAAYRQAIDIVDADNGVNIETGEDRDRVHLSKLDEDPEPASTSVLRQQLDGLLPEVDLPEILPEVDAWCRFTDLLVNVDRRPHIRDLPLSALSRAA